MNILGIGVDIVENIRINKALKKSQFINRIFTPSEILIAKKGFVINKNNEKKVIIFNGIQKNIKDKN